MERIIVLMRSPRVNKKLTAIVDGKLIHFGDSRYEDFTTHREKKRKRQYIARHKPREDWGKRGIKTPGFWSRWILWNKPTIEESVMDLKKRYNLNVRYN